MTVRALFVPPPAQAWFGNRKIHNIIKQSIKAPLVILHCLNIWQICSLLNDVQVRVNVDEIYLLSVFKLFFSFTPGAVRQSPAPPRSANASAQVRRRERAGAQRHASEPLRNAGAGQTRLPEAATELARSLSSGGRVSTRLWAKNAFHVHANS